MQQYFICHTKRTWRRPHRYRSRMAEEEKRDSHWAIAASIATVVSAAVALMAWLWPHSAGPATSGTPSKASPPAPSTLPPSAPARSPGTPSSTHVATVPTDSASPIYSVQWHGQLTLNAFGRYLDSVPPQQVARSDDGSADVSYNGELSTPSNFSLMAEWTGDGTPTRVQCDQWVSTNSVTSAPANVGDIFCVRTIGGRIAELRFTHIYQQANYATVTVVVWSLAHKP